MTHPSGGGSPSQRHTIGLLVENKTGVLARIAGLIAAKGYNIDSLTVGETHDDSVSRMTIVLHGDEWVIEQAVKQLDRIIDVIAVEDVTHKDRVERELVLVRVGTAPDDRAEICRIADIFRAKFVDVSTTTLTLELTGAPDKITAFIELLRPYPIENLYRTGKVAMLRAPKFATPDASPSTNSREETT